MNYERIEREISEALGYDSKPHSYEEMRCNLIRLTKTQRLLLDVARALEKMDDDRWLNDRGYPDDDDWKPVHAALTALKEHLE